jgi:cell division protein ZipA
MEDELRLFLLLGGTVFIIGVLAHGIWKIRKNSKPEEKTRLEPRQWQEDDVSSEQGNSEGFDELGLGEVRVVNRTPAREVSYDNDELVESDIENVEKDSDNATIKEGAEGQAVSKNSDGDDSQLHRADESDVQEKPTPEPSPEPKLYGSVVSNPKPHMAGSARNVNDAGSSSSNVAEFPEPPGFLLKEGIDEETQEPRSAGTPDEGDSRQEPKLYIDPTLQASVDEQSNAQVREVADFSLDAPQQPERVELETPDSHQKRFSRTKRTKPASRKREEPNFGDDQMRIDFDESGQDAFSANDDTDSNKSPQANIEPEVLVLNVRAPEDAPIAGAALLPMLLTLGFKFGDQDIFHRHANSNGKGPVLFSLANMFKPGVFDIDNLENFETQGVSLFMILPIEGDPHQVFNMMHNAARKLADEFNVQVLDGRRSVLTKQGLQQYVEKIREFERKRMIARS